MRERSLRVILHPASCADQPALTRLQQFCRYDLSAVSGDDVDDQGIFGHDDLDRYWNTTGFHPFLIRLDGRPAGFALVNQQSQIHDPFDGYAIDEFFVLRKYRRQGVGSAAAEQLFDRFPGHWEVATFATNVLAHTFWRSTIDRYTHGRYREVWVQKPGWRGPVQLFDVPPGP
jgi:predicted acetyltransferase